MSSKQGGKAKPLKQPKAEKKEYDEDDLAKLQKKKDEEKAMKELRAKASQKGSFGGAGLKKSGKKWEGFKIQSSDVWYNIICVEVFQFMEWSSF